MDITHRDDFLVALLDFIYVDVLFSSASSCFHSNDMIKRIVVSNLMLSLRPFLCYITFVAHSSLLLSFCNFLFRCRAPGVLQVVVARRRHANWALIICVFVTDDQYLNSSLMKISL
jgi:hypothetical protein